MNSNKRRIVVYGLVTRYGPQNLLAQEVNYQLVNNRFFVAMFIKYLCCSLRRVN